MVDFDVERLAVNQEACANLGETTKNPHIWPIEDLEQHCAITGRSTDGQLLCLAVAKIYGELAILETFRKTKDTPHASMCRSMVHAELVRALHKRGVRYLAIDGVLRLTPGLQYLQHLQGFEPVHLRVLAGSAAQATMASEPLDTTR